MNKKLEQLYRSVREYEDKYYKLSIKALDKENPTSAAIHSAQATAFQMVRYMIEDLLEK